MSQFGRKAEALMFWAQIFFAVIFAGSQALRMLSSTQGLSVAFFICHGVFALINLSLSLIALRETTEGERRVKRQSVYIYAMWALFVGTHLAIALWKMPDWWNANDTLTIQVVGVGVVATLVFVDVMAISTLDPYVRATLAILFKSVPQVALAFSIATYGKGGLSGIYMLTGHITILIRIIHLWVSNRESWNKSTKASFISEIWNEASWVIATVAWLMH